MTSRNHQVEQPTVTVPMDAERLVLGGILWSNDLFPGIASTLSESDFGMEKHRLLFRTISEMIAAQELVTPVTLATALESRNQLKSVDGLSYLTALADCPLTEKSAESYSGIVKNGSIQRQVLSLAATMQRRVERGESIEEILGEAAAGIMALSDVGAKKQQLEPISSIIDTYPGGINTLVDPAKRDKGIDTGFSKLDEFSSGLRRNELVILAARPSMGKSSLALNIAQYVATHRYSPKAVAVFSMEMSKESLLTRMLCAAARVDQQKFRSGYINQEERRRLADAAADLYDAPLYIDDTAALTLYDMQAKLDRLVASGADLGLVIVDYLQLMVGPKAENRTQAVSALARGTKIMAGSLHVPFLVLSQLGRGPEQRPDHRPMLSDLRECVVGETCVYNPFSGATVQVKDLRAGDSVLAMAPTLCIQGFRVADVWSTGVKPTFLVTMRSGLSITCTANHPFLSRGGWTRLDALEVGNRIGSAIQGCLMWEQIKSIEPAGDHEVFDISVPGANCFVANGLVVHNSGEIEQSADAVAFIFREEVYQPDKESLKGIAEIILAKQRNGPTGKFELAWLNKFTKFENLAGEVGETGTYPDQPEYLDDQYGDPRAAPDLFHSEDNQQ